MTNNVRANEVFNAERRAFEQREQSALPLASSRRFSLAIAAGAALRLPGINRQELTLALAEWRERETDATVRGELDRVLAPAPKKDWRYPVDAMGFDHRGM